MAATVALLSLGPSTAATAATAAPTSAPPPPSAVGQAFVTWIAVSPAYQRTGTVAAVASQLNCTKDCSAIWVTHDGGATWSRALAHGWQPSRTVIAVDANGHETFYGASSNGLMRSDDGGANWVPAGTGGMPTVLPSYAKDHRVAVAAAGGPADYVLDKSGPSDVDGSGGAAQDMQFMTSPEFPSGGSYDPALLVGMDPNSHLPVVFHCNANLHCGNGVPLNLTVEAWSMTSAGTLLYPSADYAEHGSVFANTPVGIQKSTDGAHTFVPLNVAPGNGATATSTPMMALAPGYREAGPTRTAYVSVFQVFNADNYRAHTAGGVYRTTDGGTTWSPLTTTGPFSGGSQGVAAAPDGRLFASYYDGSGHAGLLCSTDGGSAWQPSCPPIAGTASSKNGGAPARCPSTGCVAPQGGDAGSGAAAQGSGADSAASQDGAAAGQAAPTGSTQAGRAAAHSVWPWILLAIAIGLVLAGSAVRLVRWQRGRRTT